MKRLVFIFCALYAFSSPTYAQKSDQNKFVLIVNGAGGEAVYAKQFEEWTAQLSSVLSERFGFDKQQVTVLKGATSEDVKRTFATLKTQLDGNNVLFMFLIGHGSFDGKESKFNLVGPDLSASDYNGLLSSLPTRRVVVFTAAVPKPLNGTELLGRRPRGPAAGSPRSSRTRPRRGRSRPPRARARGGRAPRGGSRGPREALRQLFPGPGARAGGRQRQRPRQVDADPLGKSAGQGIAVSLLRVLDWRRPLAGGPASRTVGPVELDTARVRLVGQAADGASGRGAQ